MRVITCRQSTTISTCVVKRAHIRLGVTRSALLFHVAQRKMESRSKFFHANSLTLVTG